MNPFKSPQYLKILRILFILALTAVSCLNIYQYTKELKTIHKIKQRIPFSFSGLKFAGLNEIFEDVKIVGFYTDKDITDNEVAMQFAQAQLVLAPTILDLDNLEHTYILLDCTTQAHAFAKIKEIGALPLKKNQFGIILAKRMR